MNYVLEGGELKKKDNFKLQVSSVGARGFRWSKRVLPLATMDYGHGHPTPRPILC